MNVRRFFAFAHDVVAAGLAWVLAFWLRFNLDIPRDWGRAMLEHRTQWNDMNNPAESDSDKLKNVSRETQVIAWPSTRPGRLLSDVFENL